MQWRQRLPQIGEPPVRFFRMLGLATRAGKVAKGTPLSLDAVRHRKARLVILSAYASEGTKKKITSKCAFYSVPLVIVCITPERLSHTVGKEKPLVALAVTDERFATEILQSSGKDASEQSEGGM